MSLSLSGSGEISGFDAGLSGFGGLVVVKSALFTGTQTNSTAAGASFDITDLSITHEVSDAANKLVILAFVGVSANSANDQGRVGIHVTKDGAIIGAGDAADSRPRVLSGGQTTSAGGSSASNSRSLSGVFVHTPGSGSKVYRLAAVSLETVTSTVYINRTEQDNNNAIGVRGASGLVIMEVSV